MKKALGLILLAVLLIGITAVQPQIFNTSSYKMTCWILIGTLGIIHGSNDLQASYISKKSLKLPVVLLIYIVFITLGLIVYYINIELLIFILLLFSAYHFGEQQVHEIFAGKYLVNYLHHIAVGTVVFGLLFIQNWEEVAPILTAIGSENLNYATIVIITSVAFIVQFVYALFMIHIAETKQLRLVVLQLELLVLFYTFEYLDLLGSFTLYFVFWHSLPSIIDQSLLLYGNFNRKVLQHFINSAAPIYFISLTTVLVCYFTLNFATQIQFVVLIALIATLPHIVHIFLTYNWNIDKDKCFS